VLFLVGMRVLKLGRELEAVEHEKERQAGENTALKAKLAVLEEAGKKQIEEFAKQAAENSALKAKVAELEEASKKQIGWLESAEQENTWLHDELAKRPPTKRQAYQILTVGVKATGKTSLTLKWANPLIDLGAIEGTKIDRYERSVSRAPSDEGVTEHVFEVQDWGGEHMVDALRQLMVEEVHGLLMVVDLGGPGAKEVEVGRVKQQLEEFHPSSLRYFFGPKTSSQCRAVVLFINKSDLIAGTPTQVEEQAKALYQPLIGSLMRHAAQVDVRVFVGSASYGHSTHLLFSHFVEKLLPPNAYDHQLLQQMKSAFTETGDGGARRG
jgi:spore germination cell wall hydrolase CwlJ-like protein